MLVRINRMVNQKFPPDLLYLVRESIEDQGFCVFGEDEMRRLFSRVKGNRNARRELLEQFALLTGAHMETTPNLNSARFVNPNPNDGVKLILHSPACPETKMDLGEIEPGLFAYTCPQSGGVWIPFQSYLDWKEHHRQDKTELPPGSVPELADDSHQRTLICPETGRLLIRYRVGHGLKFHVDVSPESGGIWLDRGEWQALKSRGLHLELNHIFTLEYQRHIRFEEHEQALDEMFRERIGAGDFEKVAAFKQWMAEHPKRRSIRSYLLYNFRDVED